LRKSLIGLTLILLSLGAVFNYAIDIDLSQAKEQPRSDVRRVEYALGSPVYEENAISKPQSGNSWINVSDSSSASGQVMMASEIASNGGCLFGPYITLTPSGEDMSGKPYLAAFSLKVSSNASSSVVASIDVACNQGVILQSMQVKANDFRSSNGWQDFSLPFTVPVSMTVGLEFRTINYNNGVVNLFFDKTSITQGWNDSTLYVEAAYNKPKSRNGPWSVMNDPSSLSGQVMHALRFSQENDWLYGPYIKESLEGNSMLGYACIATFRLKVSANQYADPVARIDIAYNAGSVLQSKTINASDFDSSNIWQDFPLTFVVPNNLTYGLEFRVQNLNSGFEDLFADVITIVRWGDSSVVFTESAVDKPQSAYDASWSKVSDSSSFSGLVMKASISSANDNWLYGPYITSDSAGRPLSGKPYVAVFRLKVSANPSTNTVAYVDVAYDTGIILQSMQIRANGFAHAYFWQDFNLSFNVPSTLNAGLEFRVQNLNNNVTDLSVDTITVRQGWNNSDVYVEAAFNKPQAGSTWSKVLDSSSASGLVMEASDSSPGNDWLYGPYIMSDWNEQSMLGNAYTARFRLKVSSNTPHSWVIYVDVACNAGKALQSKLIRASDFVSANAWQDFNLTFTVPLYLAYGLEFRILDFNNGVTDVYADRITVDHG
jgi:hypothetical protein